MKYEDTKVPINPPTINFKLKKLKGILVNIDNSSEIINQTSATFQMISDIK